MSKSESKKKLPLIYAVGIIGAIYFAGIIGLRIEIVREIFLAVLPWTMILIFGLLMYFQKYWNLRAIQCLLIGFITLFVIVIIAVDSGDVFGSFTFSKLLGLKLFKVPVALIFNWLTMIYCVYVMVKSIKTNAFFRAVIGSVMVVLTILLMETFNNKFQLWFWDSGHAPLRNYMAWAIISFGILMYYNNAKSKIRNELALPVYIGQIIFLLSFELF